MSEGPVRPIRKVAIPDHLWDALELMAREMGSERDALLSQSIFTFARLNGFLTHRQPAGAQAPGAEANVAAAPAGGSAAADDRTPGPTAPLAPVPRAAPPRPQAEERPAPARAEHQERPAEKPAEKPASAERPAEKPVEKPAARPPVAAVRPPVAPSDSNLRRPPSARPEQQSGSAPAQLFATPPTKLDEDPARREVAERVLETAAELERLIKGKSEKKAAEAFKAEPPAMPPPAKAQDTAVMDKEGRPAGEKALYLMAEDGDLDKVVKDKFLIGRGKHCDFIINSGKVSREHAVIVREGTDYFIEDLGSSNGTWFNKQRIKRRKIEDGDEYYVCSEKIKCVIR